MEFMSAALQQARQGFEVDEVPVGAVIVKDGEIIAESGNRIVRDNDPTAHAEMVVIRQACEKLGTDKIAECDLYVTLEPCVMCCSAISYARLRRVYFGAVDEKRGGVFWFNNPTCHHKPEVYDGIMETECGEILRDFFAQKR